MLICIMWLCWSASCDKSYDGLHHVTRPMLICIMCQALCLSVSCDKSYDGLYYVTSPMLICIMWQVLWWSAPCDKAYADLYHVSSPMLICIMWQVLCWSVLWQVLWWSASCDKSYADLYHVTSPMLICIMWQVLCWSVSCNKPYAGLYHDKFYVGLYYVTSPMLVCIVQCYSWGGAMGHRPIQQKNGPLTTEIAILNLERITHWNFIFIGNKWKMAHTMVCPAITLIMWQVLFRSTSCDKPYAGLHPVRSSIALYHRIICWGPWLWLYISLMLSLSRGKIAILCYHMYSILPN